MKRTTAVIIGAGQSGLAFSHELSARSVDHVVLERAEIANSWKTERWDSLRLLTPNWQTRLSGFSYNGNDPDGYMTMNEVAGFLNDYATYVDAPVQTNTEVLSVSVWNGGYLVKTTNGNWICRDGRPWRARCPDCSKEFPRSASCELIFPEKKNCLD